jgi:CheY-like chemotaxis protein
MQTVLVIEKNRANRDNILRILRYDGFRTIGAETAALGIELAQRYLPHLVLCDISPGLDGYGVLETLGRISATQHIPLIFVTTKASPVEVQYGLSLGVDGYLTKPFSSSQLRESIAQCLAADRDRTLKVAVTNSYRAYLSHSYSATAQPHPTPKPAPSP